MVQALWLLHSRPRSILDLHYTILLQYLERRCKSLRWKFLRVDGSPLPPVLAHPCIAVAKGSGGCNLNLSIAEYLPPFSQSTRGFELAASCASVR